MVVLVIDRSALGGPPRANRANSVPATTHHRPVWVFIALPPIFQLTTSSSGERIGRNACSVSANPFAGVLGLPLLWKTTPATRCRCILSRGLKQGPIEPFAAKHERSSTI